MKTLLSIVAIAVALPALLVAGVFGLLFEEAGCRAGLVNRGQGR